MNNQIPTPQPTELEKAIQNEITQRDKCEEKSTHTTVLLEDALKQIQDLEQKLQAVEKERDLIKHAFMMEHIFTCIHHNDAERKASHCPVCLAKDRDQLKDLTEKQNEALILIAKAIKALVKDPKSQESTDLCVLSDRTSIEALTLAQQAGIGRSK